MRKLILAIAGLGLLALHTACVDKVGSDTGTAPLYVFDGATGSVKVWSDISTLYTAGSTSGPNRTITSSLLGTSFDLGWGGMALDSSNQYLYLVAATGGKVVRISKVGSQSGALSSTSDIISFSLNDASTDTVSGTFGQASVNPLGTYLYVTEVKDSNSQIWAIPTASITSGGSFTSSSVIWKTSDIHDYGCTGVTAGDSTSVYAFFSNGNQIELNQSGTYYNGPERLRKGTSAGFTASGNVIIGLDTNDTTELAVYGCLAYDTSNDYLYFGRQSSTDPVLRFTPGDFNSSAPVDVAPDATLQGPSDLRVLAHGGQKDWLVGAVSSDNTTGQNTLYIWKAPSEGDTHKAVTLPTGVTIFGLALDGSQ